MCVLRRGLLPSLPVILSVSWQKHHFQPAHWTIGSRRHLATSLRHILPAWTKSFPAKPEFETELIILRQKSQNVIEPFFKIYFMMKIYSERLYTNVRTNSGQRMSSTCCFARHSAWTSISIALSLLLRSRLDLVTLPWKHEGWSIFVLSKAYSVSVEDFWRSLRLTIGFFVSTTAKALLAQLLSLAKWASFRNIWFLSVFFNCTVMGLIVLPELYKTLAMFFTPD